MPTPAAPDTAPARVLLVRLSALGDVVFALPSLLAARRLWPRSRLEWLIEDRVADLLAGHPALDELLVYPRRSWRDSRGLQRIAAAAGLRRYRRDLRRRSRYDWIVDFQGNLKSGLHLWSLDAACKIGFAPPAAREGAWRFYDRRVPDPGRVHRVERDLSLLRALGFQGPAPAAQSWPLPPAAEQAVAAGLESASAAGAPLVLLHTAVTAYGRDKAWPRESWLELARRLERRGARVLLLWAGGERETIAALAEDSGGVVELAPATPDLAHLMALLDRSDLIIGTDSGPLHLAAFRGRPVLALYGPTDPVVYAPYGPRVQVIYPLPKGTPPPPRRRGRPSPLMGLIAVDQVEAAAAGMLAAGR